MSKIVRGTQEHHDWLLQQESHFIDAFSEENYEETMEKLDDDYVPELEDYEG